VSELILAIDTTHEFGGVALLDGGKTIAEELVHAPDGFGHVLYGHLQRLLERHGLKPDQIACFAAASGPGSFTGVRVGLACIKGLAHATGRGAAGVSNLEALSTYGSAPLRAVLLDARRGEVYGAVYDAERRAVVGETVGAFADWLASVPAGDVEFISTDLAPFAPLLQGRRMTQAPRPIAAAIGRIAWARLRAGIVENAAAIDANYVRRSDAELQWKQQP
jgi:tRNA threonylcarbamoyladenosine biosynthesis protein TsaB